MFRSSAAQRLSDQGSFSLTGFEKERLILSATAASPVDYLLRRRRRAAAAARNPGDLQENAGLWQVSAGLGGSQSHDQPRQEQTLPVKRLLFLVRLEDTSPRSGHRWISSNISETVRQQPSDFCRCFSYSDKQQFSTQAILFIQRTTRYRRDHAGKKKKKKIQEKTSGENKEQTKQKNLTAAGVQSAVHSVYTRVQV